MRELVYSISPVHYTDLNGMESWLEEMASKGYILEWVGYRTGIFTFSVSEPKQYRYRLIASTHKMRQGIGFRAQSAPPPDEKTQEFHREFGWEYMATRKDFHIYCAKDPSAPEMDTDPVIQATAIHAAAKRYQWELFSVILIDLILLFFGVFYYFRYLFGLTDSYYRSTHILLNPLVILFINISILYRFIRLKRLEKRLLSGDRLTHRSDWRKHYALHLLSKFIEPACYIIAIVISINSMGNNDTNNAIPLDTYNETIPFATMEEVLSGTELREDAYWSQTMEKRSGIAGETLILHQHQHITMPGGRESSGYLDVTYSEVSFDWIADLCYNFDNWFKDRAYEDVYELTVNGADQAFGCQNSFNTYVAIRKDDILLTATLNLNNWLPLSPEELAQIMLDSME